MTKLTKKQILISVLFVLFFGTLFAILLWSGMIHSNNKTVDDGYDASNDAVNTINMINNTLD